MTASYYHSIDPRDAVFCHNVYVCKGRLTAISLVRGADPTLAGMRSPYEVLTREAAKENVFEAIRANEFSNAPPRMGAIYLFDSFASAQSANSAWWQGQRAILQAEVILAKRVGEFDAELLNAPREQWEEAARAYWSGLRSSSPRIEVLVDGIVQLHGWEAYGRLWSAPPQLGP